MTDTDSQLPVAGSARSEYQIAMIVYILYFLGFFTAITALAGIVIAEIKVREAQGDLLTHYIYQRRTFWYGLGMIVIGGLLLKVAVGFVVLLFWGLWTLI